MRLITQMPSASEASSYTIGFESMRHDLNCTQFQATIGLSVYALGFGTVPLITASLSEEFGRHPLYISTCFGFMMMQLLIAWYVSHSHIPYGLLIPSFRRQLQKHSNCHRSAILGRCIWVDRCHHGGWNDCRHLDPISVRHPYIYAFLIMGINSLAGAAYPCRSSPYVLLEVPV